MAEPTSRDRLQPSLLDRLTDDAPEQKQEARHRQTLSSRKLKQVVLRDLAWLFNTGRLEATEDLSQFPQVRDTVINYGLPDLAGQTASQIDLADLEQRVQHAIWEFEPRILKKSVKVRAFKDEDEMSHNALSFIIEGVLWGDPQPQQIRMKTEIDLESGNVLVNESGGPGGD